MTVFEAGNFLRKRVALIDCGFSPMLTKEEADAIVVTLDELDRVTRERDAFAQAATQAEARVAGWKREAKRLGSTAAEAP